MSPPQLQGFKTFLFSLREESRLRPRLLCRCPCRKNTKTGYSLATFMYHTIRTLEDAEKLAGQSPPTSCGKHHDILEGVQGHNRNYLVTRTPPTYLPAYLGAISTELSLTAPSCITVANCSRGSAE